MKTQTALKAMTESRDFWKTQFLILEQEKLRRNQMNFTKYFYSCWNCLAIVDTDKRVKNCYYCGVKITLQLN